LAWQGELSAVLAVAAAAASAGDASPDNVDTDIPFDEFAADSAAGAVAAARESSFAFGLFVPAVLVFPVCLPAVASVAVAVAVAVPVAVAAAVAAAAAALDVVAWTTRRACCRYCRGCCCCRGCCRVCCFENVVASLDGRILNLNLAMEHEGAS